MATTAARLSRPIEAPDINPEIGANPDDARESRLLLQAFDMFTQASSSLESAFHQLQERTERLARELEFKNQELQTSLEEKEEVRNYLEAILECLPCGVVALDRRGSVMLSNPVASGILELPKPDLSRTRTARRPSKNPILRTFLEMADRPAEGCGELEFPIRKGETTRFLAASRTDLHDASGRRIGNLHILRDVTEVKALQEQNKLRERLAAMGEMAVELAHEIRNPLGSIELFASLLEKELATEGEPRRWAQNIRVGSRSLNSIITNMLQFANPIAPAYSATDVHEVIEEILNFADPILKQREVEVGRDLQAAESIILGDREQLKQMLLNLVLNSMQAMPSQGRLELATRNIDRLPGGAPAKALEIRVQDAGLGIPPEHLTRIFDPFFTTNRNGTGLGLSVVHQIVERHSGFIHVESEVNVGTCFIVVLPSDRLMFNPAQ